MSETTPEKSGSVVVKKGLNISFEKGEVISIKGMPCKFESVGKRFIRLELLPGLKVIKE